MTAAADDGGGRRLDFSSMATAAGAAAAVAGDDNILYIYWRGGGNANILLTLLHSFIYAKLAKSANTSRKSPGSLQEVFSQLLPDS